jgi:hypothetical protein
LQQQQQLCYTGGFAMGQQQSSIMAVLVQHVVGRIKAEV